MANVGAWPVDATTQTGLFRTEIGDVAGTPIEGTQTAEFEYLSDAAIAALLQAWPTMPNMAKSAALSSMAYQMIAAAQDIQVDDIRIKTVERAELMLKAATDLATSAGGALNATGFSVVHLASEPDSYHYRVPQGTPRPVGESGF